jgi:ABC-type iron transport system FetAB permease component
MNTLLQPRPGTLEQPIVELSSLDLLLAAGLVLIAVGVSRWQGLGP